MVNHDQMFPYLLFIMNVDCLINVVAIVFVVCICTENKLRYEVASRMTMWSSIAFFFAMVVNVIVALFYPYNREVPILGEWV